MLRKRYEKTILATVLVATILGGGSFIPACISEAFGVPSKAYAIDYADTFNPTKTGFRTETGWITSKVKCENNMPENATLEEMKAISMTVTPESNPEIMEPDESKTGWFLDVYKLFLTDKIYHYRNAYEKYGITTDAFQKVIGLELAEDSSMSNPEYMLTIAICTYLNGELDDKVQVNTIKVKNANTYAKLVEELETEKPSEPGTSEKPTTPTKPEESKNVTAKRLGGLTRFETATAIAKEVNSEKLDAVVLANAFTFPDALTGTTLATQKNAPILLVGSSDKDFITFDYMKNNLKAGGTVYALGGTSAVSSEVEAKIKAMGYNIKRLGGSDRYATNMSIVNELNIAKGSDIVIGDALGYADNLSISGIAGKKNMPILLVNNEVTPELLAKIKSIAPKNIYILGGTTAVNADVESKLKTVGNVVRLGGLDRYETSLKIANYFTDSSQDTALVAYGLNFPDALTGGALAGKTGAPVLLVNKEAEAQKQFINSKNINNIYILGGETALSNSIINELKK